MFHTFTQGSFLFRLDLLTDHELGRVLGTLEAVWPCCPMVLCARRVDWFWRRTSAYFGEARVGFPVGKICLFQNAVGLPMSPIKKECEYEYCFLGSVGSAGHLR